MSELAIDPALWQGDDLDAQLAGHFSDIRGLDAFKAFILRKRAGDPTAAFIGWRRIYNRYGLPELVAVVIWKGEERRWRFPLLATFVAPDTGRRHLVFEARLKRIGLDLGLAIYDVMFDSLPGVTFEMPK